MDTYDLIARLVRSSLEFDKKSVEALALMISRKVKKERPDIAREIAKSLSYSEYDNLATRSLDMAPLPDRKSVV